MTTLIQSADMSRLSPESQKKLIEHFFLKELISNDLFCSKTDMKKTFETIFNDGKLQVLGDCDTIFDAFNTLVSFPGSHEYFGIKDTETYNAELLSFKSNTKMEYMYKRDFYSLLGTFIKGCPQKGVGKTLCISLVHFYLRMQEKKMSSSHEMAPLLKPRIQELTRRISLINEMFKSGERKKIGKFEFEGKNLDDLFHFVCGMLYFKESETQTPEEILDLLKEFSKRMPIEEIKLEINRILSWTKFIIREFADYIETNKFYMLPRSETIDTIKTPKATIRVFDVDSNKFVMAHELLKSLKSENFDVSGIEEQILEMPRLSVLTTRQVFEMIPQTLTKLEFINIPVAPYVYGITRIPTIDGRFCCFTSDVFQKFVSDLISVRKVFERIEPAHWNLIELISEKLIEILSDCNGLIDSEDVQRFNVIFNDWYEYNFPSSNYTKKRVLQKTKFAFEDLKKELKHLGLVKIFPEIMAVAEKQFKTTMSETNHTISMFYYAIEACQALCVIDKLPKLSDLCHEKQVCDSVCSSVFSCEMCPWKTEEESATEETNILEVQEKVDVTETESSTPDEQESGFPKDVTLNVPTKKNQDKKNKKKNKKNPESTEKTEEKESQVCPKCCRASEHTRKINEKLRLEKIETKALKKKLMEMESEKDLRIRLLERQIQLLQNEIVKKDDVIQNFEAKEQEKEVQVQQLLNEILEETFIPSENVMEELVELEVIPGMVSEEVITSDSSREETLSISEVVPETSSVVDNEHSLEIMEAHDKEEDSVPAESFEATSALLSEEVTPDELSRNPPVHPNELADSECLICLEEMAQQEETIKCDICKRRYCGDCIRQWFETKRTCPTCSSGLLDNDEFPALS